MMKEARRKNAVAAACASRLWATGWFPSYNRPVFLLFSIYRRSSCSLDASQGPPPTKDNTRRHLLRPLTTARPGRSCHSVRNAHVSPDRALIRSGLVGNAPARQGRGVSPERAVPFCHICHHTVIWLDDINVSGQKLSDKNCLTFFTVSARRPGGKRFS